MDNNEVRQLCKTGTRFFYGYIVVLSAFLILMVSFGLYSSFGIFFKPLLTEFGWTRAMTSGAYSLSMILHGVLGIVMGGLNDRFGPRLVMTICGFFLCLGYLLMSQTSALWQLYLFYGLIIGIGMSGIWVPLMSTVARWFNKKRSLMTGIVIAGAGIGQLIAPPMISWLIFAYGWRLSYVIIGSTVLLILVSAAQFLRRDPTKMGLLPYGEGKKGERQQALGSEFKVFSLKDAVYTTQFWLALSMLFCFGFCMVSITIHIVPYATDLKISAINAANILAAIGGIGVLGNYVLGGIADRIGNRHVFIIGFILMSAALFYLVSARETWMLYLFAAVFGFAVGGISASESPLVASLFGLSSHGLIYAVLSLGFTAGASVGPFVAGYLFDINGSYQVAFLLSAVMGIVGIIVTLALRPTRSMGGRI